MPPTNAPAAPGPTPSRGAVWAHVLPLILFAGLLTVPDALRGFAVRAGWTSWWLRSPELWLYSLQAVLCAAALAWFWPRYRFAPFGPRALGWGAAAGLLAFAVWVCPQMIFGVAARTADGFNPTPLADRPGLYGAVLAGRLLRLIVVVPLVEEIFWRGFLLRFLVREDFERMPFRFTSFSFGVVTALFVLEHGRADWPAAAVTGVLYNLVAIRTQSLGACVLAHAVTNGLLGAYILTTRQWGFW